MTDHVREPGLVPGSATNSGKTLPTEGGERAGSFSSRAMKGPWHASRVDSEIYIYNIYIYISICNNEPKVEEMRWFCTSNMLVPSIFNLDSFCTNSLRLNFHSKNRQSFLGVLSFKQTPHNHLPGVFTCGSGSPVQSKQNAEHADARVRGT